MQRKPRKTSEILKGLYKMPGSPYWWYRWSENGKRYAVSLKTESESEAILEKVQIAADVERRGSEAYRTIKGDEGRPKQPIDKVIDQYLDEARNRTKKAMRPNVADNVGLMLKNFCKDMDIAGLSDVNTVKMVQWLRGKKQAGRALETIRSYSRDLRAWLGWLINEGLVSRKMPMLEMPDTAPVGRKNWLEQEQIDTLIEKASGDLDLQFVMHCGFNAGFRRNEISEARVEWFDLKHGLVHVYSGASFTTKDRDRRAVPIKKAFKEFLESYLAGRERQVSVQLKPTINDSLSKLQSEMQLARHAPVVCFKPCEQRGERLHRCLVVGRCGGGRGEKLCSLETSCR
jgi:site-specific recombinase XerD